MATPVITIDGPSGSGKGTVARYIATLLGFHRLDSGALYRLLALHCLQSSVNIETVDDATLQDMAQSLPIKFSLQADAEIILLNGQDVSQEIRSEKVGNLASILATRPIVRAGLLAKQHAFLQAPGLVADGRDMGTVVFPKANLKIFLDASPEERAKRRAKQLSLQEENDKIAGLLQMIKQRDARDRERSIAPLQPASDAIYIDSSDYTADEIVEKVYQLALEQLS